MKQRERYIQFYDDHGLEILGSDGVMFFDQRIKTPWKIFALAEKHARRMINVRKICYARIYYKPIGRGSLVHDTCMLWDPTDARYIWDRMRNTDHEAQS